MRQKLEQDLALPLPEMVSSERLLKKQVAGVFPVVFYYARKLPGRVERIGFYVDSDAGTEEQARKLGQQWRRAMVPLSKLHFSDPSFHELLMYVGWADGYVDVPPLGKAAKKESATSKKTSLVQRGQDYFGRKGFSITGEKGAYRMEIRPVLRRFKGVFGATAVSRPTLEELEALLEELEARLDKIEGRAPNPAPPNVDLVRRLRF